MVEFLWKDPEEDYQIVTLPDGVQAPSASSAPTAAQWDLQRVVCSDAFFDFRGRPSQAGSGRASKP